MELVIFSANILLRFDEFSGYIMAYPIYDR